MNPPFVRSPYNYDVRAASDEAAYTETMPSLTVQSQSEDSDLNVLMKRFGVTGHMPQNVRQPTYGDFTNITDFHSALAALNSATDSFMQFPADIRAQFQNDPQHFLEFIENPANLEQTRKWFPQEDSYGQVQTAGTGGASPPQSSPPNAQSGVGTPLGNGGTQLPQRPAESGQVVPGGKT